MSEKYDINTLVAKMLMGEITIDECRFLQETAEANPSLKNKIETLMQATDLTQRYHIYKNINIETAKRHFLESHKRQKIHALPRNTWLRHTAAAIMVAFVAVSGWLAFNYHAKKSVPTLNAEMVTVIEKLNNSGQNGATLTINGCTPIPVTDANNALAQTERMENSNKNATIDSKEGVLTTQHDKEFWMKLDDGTYVHLNYNSQLIYPTRFVGNERRVRLEGEAYFIIAKDGSERPFIVETANGDVHDYGTEFNVSTYAQENTTEVVLVKGKVSVNLKNSKQHMLNPGELATLQEGHDSPTIEQVDVNLYTSWNTGNFYFDGCTLKELMGVLARWNAMKVDFSDTDIENIQFTGNIDKYEPLLPTLKAIEHITGLNINIKDKTICINRK